MSRNKRGWTVEVEIDALDAFGVPLLAGAEWKMNAHRQFRLKKFPNSSWSFNPGRWHAVEYLGGMKIE